MNPVDQMIGRLRALSDVTMFDRGSAWPAVIKKAPTLVFDVTIPKAVREWFASAEKDGREIWSDWTEHYATSGESKAQLEQEMARDIEDFVRRVVDSQITEFDHGSASVLWVRSEGQKYVTIYDPGA